MWSWLKKKRAADRWTKLCGNLDIAAGAGLEFGPLDRPLVPKAMGNIRYVDVKSAEELRRLIPVSDAHKLEDFVDVDYIWNGGRLRDVIGAEIRFDYVLASHVIEHTPNLIGWLNDLTSVLKPAGVIALAIPDKRRTFDVLRAPTTASTVVADWLRDEAQPRAHHVFDHFANVVQVPSGKDFIALCEGRFDPSTLPKYHTLDEALEFARQAEVAGAFTNCHTYAFTPDSFLDVLDTTRKLGLHSLVVQDFHPTTKRGAEFFVRLHATPTEG